MPNGINEEMTEVPAPEVPAPEEAAAPTPGGMSHTVDEVPELEGLAVGDTITFRIENVSDDGNVYELAPIAPEETGGLAGEEMGGREQITRELL